MAKHIVRLLQMMQDSFEMLPLGLRIILVIGISGRMYDDSEAVNECPFTAFLSHCKSGFTYSVNFPSSVPLPSVLLSSHGHRYPV